MYVRVDIGVASMSRRMERVAKQINHISSELRGAAEGSVLTDQPGATPTGDMTNGSVSRNAAFALVS